MSLSSLKSFNSFPSIFWINIQILWAKLWVFLKSYFPQTNESPDAFNSHHRFSLLFTSSFLSCHSFLCMNTQSRLAFSEFLKHPMILRPFHMQLTKTHNILSITSILFVYWILRPTEPKYHFLKKPHLTPTPDQVFKWYTFTLSNSPL